MLDISFKLDDADREAGVTQARLAYNASLADHKHDVATDQEYANMIAPAAFDAFRGAVRRSLAAKIEQLNTADLAAVAAVVDAKVAQNPRLPGTASDPVEAEAIPLGK